MNDPYVFPHTAVLKNLADIRDEEILSCMEAEYTSLRLAELVTHKSASCFDFDTLCSIHRYIFQDIYEWAGNIRIINIEKAEPALGGLSVEYSDYANVQRDIISTLKSMNEYPLETETLEVVAKLFSGGLADLWKIHPYRDGNIRVELCRIM